MRPRQHGLLLAMPSKGTLHERAVEFLQRCGLELRRSGNGREYAARLSGAENVSVLFFRPEEIPARVEQGDAHVGITGEDLYRELGDGPPLSHLLIRQLGFGSARLVVAVPQSWIDVTSIDEMEEVAFIHRQKSGRSLRVATKFPRLTRAFFAENGITDYQIVESIGATEGTPSAGLADLIVDLTSTGTTLTQNHLKEIASGTVLESQACMIASLRAQFWTQAALDSADQVVDQIEARIRAAAAALVRFDLPLEQVEAVREALVSRYQCSVRPVGLDMAAAAPGAQFFRSVEMTAFCPRGRIHPVVTLLRSAGCFAIAVSNCEFLFDASSRTGEAFRQLLKRHDFVSRKERKLVSGHFPPHEPDF
jgi:ATP phosphoribosyltransferase